MLVDKASDLAYAILPAPGLDKKVRALKKAEAIAFKNGLTTVDDAGLNRDILELIDNLHRANELKIRVYGMISNSKENLDYYLDKGISGNHTVLTIRSMGLCRWSLGSRGAALKSPYADDPKNNGLFLTTKEEIESLAFVFWLKKAFK